jgi:hypothetical protein
MGYCTASDVKGRNHALLDDADSGDIASAIAKAQGIVDGMLRKGYPVPLSVVPEEIAGITADLAASSLLADIAGNNGQNEEPIQAQDLRKNAMDLLKMINDGDFLLDVPAPAEETSVLRQARCNTYGVTTRFGSWDPSDPSTYQ